jgi:hypothetical protein
VDLVDKLGKYTNLIIEPYNEPWATSVSGYGNWMNASRLNEWQFVWQKIIDKIRMKEAEKGYVNHLIVVAYSPCLGYWGDLNANWHNFNWISSHPLIDPASNLLCSNHAYRYWGSVGTQEDIEERPYDYNTIKNIYQQEKVDYYASKVPIYIGEMGTFSKVDSTNKEYLWMQATLKIWNEWKLSYAVWEWRDTPDFNICNILESNSEALTGGTVNKYGQLLVDAIAHGETSQKT